MSHAVTYPSTQLAGKQVWLRHLTQPALSMPVQVQSLDSITSPINESVLAVLSRARPIVITDGARKSFTGTISLILRSQPERAAFIQLTKDGSPLLFTSPPGWQWEYASAYMSLGAIAWTNPSGIGQHPIRYASAPFTLVDPPTAGFDVVAGIG